MYGPNKESLVQTGDYYRLSTTIHPQTAEALRSAKIFRGLSITKLVWQGLATYDLALSTEFEGGGLYAGELHDVPLGQPRDIVLEEVDNRVRLPLNINVNNETAQFIKNASVLEGTTIDCLVDRGVLFQSKLVTEQYAGHMLIQRFSDGKEQPFGIVGE